MNTELALVLVLAALSAWDIGRRFASRGQWAGQDDYEAMNTDLVNLQKQAADLTKELEAHKTVIDLHVTALSTLGTAVNRHNNVLFKDSMAASQTQVLSTPPRIRR